MRRIRQVLATVVAASVVAALGLLVGASPSAAAPPAPVVLNTGGQNSGDAQWAETQQLPDDGEVRTFFATFLVQHARGRAITAVRVDRNFDAADNTADPSTSVPVVGQTYVGSGGGIETSKVTVAVNLGKPGGFSCSFAGFTRSVDAPIRARVVDSTGELGAVLATNVKFVADENCAGQQDFPRLTSASQSGVSVSPGQNIVYSFTCDDVDVDGFSSDDDCDRANVRWRRLNDGATSSATLKTGINDQTTQSHTMSFPARGHYVVEAQLGNENGAFPNTGGPSGGWWRLGNAVVNDPASSLSGSISFPGAQPSTPASVNAGDTVGAQAVVADAGGAVQVIEWDGDGNGTFERMEYTTPTVVGGDIVHPALTSGELTQPVNTANAGLKQVQARITDNGSLDGADSARRQLMFSAPLRVNAIPTANGSSVTTDENTPVAVTLSGHDADNQPEALVYEIVSGPPASAGSVGAVSGNTVTFTPAQDFVGATSFTFRVRDGGATTIAAWAPSAIATVSVTVVPSPDPTADAGGPYSTQEGANVALDGTGSAAANESAAITTYEWDLDDDGQYDDATGASPTFAAVGQDGVFPIGLRVTDASGNTDTDASSVTVANVAPTVTIDPVAATDEGDTLTVSGTVTDPGWEDELSATIDLDDGAGPQPLAGVLENDRPDATFSFSVQKQYGDDGAFDVRVEAADDDTTGADTRSAVVGNVDPDVAIDDAGMQSYGGVSAFIMKGGDDVTVPATATDPGSDDLTFTWTWGDGTTDSETSLVNGPQADGPTTPSVQPRDVTLERTHAVSGACLDEVTVGVTDDDGGSGSDAGAVIVTGDADSSRGSGYWLNQYRPKRGSVFTDAELQCYLEIVSHVSLTFDDLDRSDAIAVLSSSGRSNPRAQFDQQALAAWLNFANGAVALDTMVDTTGDGVPDTTFGDAMLTAENTRATGTDAEIRAQRDILERIVLRDTD